MSESLEFCKKRASNPEVSSFADRDWSKAVEVDVAPIFHEMVGHDKWFTVSGYRENGAAFQCTVIVRINPFGEYDYFASDSFLSDGTLLFEHESMMKILSRVICLGSYNKELGEPHNLCEVYIRIGNFVVLNEHGNFKTEDGRQMNSRTTILLPVKMKYDEEL